HTTQERQSLHSYFIHTHTVTSQLLHTHTHTDTHTHTHTHTHNTHTDTPYTHICLPSLTLKLLTEVYWEFWQHLTCPSPDVLRSLFSSPLLSSLPLSLSPLSPPSLCPL